MPRQAGADLPAREERVERRPVRSDGSGGSEPARKGSALSLATRLHQPDLLLAQPNFEQIARFDAELSDVRGTDHQIAIKLNFREITQFASASPLACCSAQLQAFGIKQSFVERREVQSFLAIAAGCHIAAVTNEFGTWSIA